MYFLVLLVFWGVIAMIFFGIAAAALVIGLVLLPFRIGLGILKVGVMLLVFPFRLLAHR